MLHNLRFLCHFLRNPRQVGSVAPSSPYLAETILSSIHFDQARTIVELGSGTGAFTPLIQSNLKPPGAVFFALDINASMCAHLRQRYPDVAIYCDSAANIGQYLERHGVTHADCIISSLPWAAFDAALQDELMHATVEALRPGGQFITFAYLQGMLLPSGRRFRGRLTETFSHVSRSRIVWQNIPPAFLYICHKG